MSRSEDRRNLSRTATEAGTRNLMSRRAARFTQADINRALRAIAQSGVAATIEIGHDGAIRITPQKVPGDEISGDIAPQREIVL